MLRGLYQSGIILSTILAFYVVDFVLIARYDRQRHAEGSGRSWDFTAMAIAAATFLVIQPVWLPQLGLYTAAAWGLLVQVAGLMLILGALTLHWWARTHLGQFYAERVEVQPEHRLVDGGPYALVRHPVITSFFGIVAGLLLVNPSLPLLLMSIYTFWDFGRAAKREEALLSEQLPGYADYINRTSRFLPRWRRYSGGR